MDLTFVRITEWPGQRAKFRRDAQFKAGYDNTLKFLEKELDFLDAKQVVAQVDVNTSQLRRDGNLRVDASFNSPGVILSFNSKFGPLSYPCDTFTHWKDNLRAIALALEALRKVERYGVTKRGEQYKGWEQLPPPPVKDYEKVICEAAGVAKDYFKKYPGMVYKLALKRSHPDAGGFSDLFIQVREAGENLGL